MQQLQQPIRKVPLPRARTVYQFRLIAQCSGIYKLLARHLLVLMDAALPEMPEHQAGFLPARSTYDNISAARRVLDELSTGRLCGGGGLRPQPGSPAGLAQPSMDMAALIRVLLEYGMTP